MEGVKEIIIPIGKKHRVVIDELNHALQVERISKKTGKLYWKTLGYYKDFSNIVNRLATVSELEAGEYDAVKYANTVIDKANELCQELEGKGLK